MSFTMTDLLSIIRNIADICLVWLIIYFILNNLKNNVKLTLLFKGVFFIRHTTHCFFCDNRFDYDVVCQHYAYTSSILLIASLSITSLRALSISYTFSVLTCAVFTP